MDPKAPIIDPNRTPPKPRQACSELARASRTACISGLAQNLTKATPTPPNNKKQSRIVRACSGSLTIFRQAQARAHRDTHTHTPPKAQMRCNSSRVGVRASSVFGFLGGVCSREDPLLPGGYGGRLPFTVPNKRGICKRSTSKTSG